LLVRAAHDEVMSPGARLLKPVDAVDSAEKLDNHQFYVDPAGHPFGLCWVIEG
jgi:hypothetical protein